MQGACISVHMWIHTSIRMSMHTWIHMSIDMFVHMFIHPPMPVCLPRLQADAGRCHYKMLAIIPCSPLFFIARSGAGQEGIGYIKLCSSILVVNA